MSGGVDSSVAAARLVQEGHHVTGVTMQLLPEGDDAGGCCSTDALRSARRVCDTLGIAHHTLNMREVFRRDVIEPFVASYAAGATPNPCIDCNQRMKFSHLLAKARTQGADALATGHYARVATGLGGTRSLERAADRGKDQSYFLYRLTEPALGHVLFPLGDVTKEWVRAEAGRLGLPSATRPDSQEVCFIPQDPGSFVAERRAEAGLPGPVVDESGKRVGVHRGVCRYTVGQRKGLHLASGPWYVSEVRPRDNTVVVSRGVPATVERIAL
ncbi:MAG TPA: tRNA 2-thiouridine(34) synthase MnmA, partial [Coriobacteriia bacterium]|nr:tRNA 2-thiouridine(34) synthase MnmA [Coriobacteriia bacterium]